MTPLRTFETPRERDLGLRRIANRAGLSISVLPNGCVFAIEHEHERGRTLINQVHGSPLGGGIARLFLRLGAGAAGVVEAVGAGANAASAPPRIASPGRARPRACGTPSRSGCTPSATSGCGGSRWPTPAPSPLDLRRDPRAGRRSRRARLRHEQRGLCVAVHRPPCRPASALRSGGDEPAEPRPGHRAPVGRARLPRWRRRLRHRRDAAARPGVSGRGPDRPRRSTCRASASSTRSPVR